MTINEQKLDKLAELAIKTGVALQKGQDLLLTAPIEALPLVRRIAVHAYQAGANIVTLPPSIFEEMYKHDLTDQGIKQFDKDWKKLNS